MSSLDHWLMSRSRGLTPEQQIRRGYKSVSYGSELATVGTMTTEELCDSDDD